MSDNYYGTITALSWILGHYFYNKKHYAYIASEYYPYRLPNPKSSNPHLIYQDTYQPWKDRDEFDVYISKLRAKLTVGVAAQQSINVIDSGTASDLDNICNKVDIVFFYPLVLQVDISVIDPARRLVKGSGATVGSSEFLIEALDESELTILFDDFDTDSDFKTLVVDEILGLSTTSQADALRIIKSRC